MIIDEKPIVKNRRLKINWLLRAGQAGQDPEDFLRTLFRVPSNCAFADLGAYIPKVEYDSTIPAEIFCSFGCFYVQREEIIKGVSASEFFKRFSAHWPGNFILPEEVRSMGDYARVLANTEEDDTLSMIIREGVEKRDPLEGARAFLKELTGFIEDIKGVVLETGKRGDATEWGRYVSARVEGDVGFIVTNGIICPSGHVLKFSALGPDTLIKLLDGQPSTAFKICPQCDRLFFNLSKRRMFCSQECNSKSKYSKRTKKTGYHESRQLISRKYYMKRKKFMTDTEIAQIWRSEGIEEKRIKRLLPEAS
jgi:hypothetical protein